MDQRVADMAATTLGTLTIGRTRWSSRDMARASRLVPSTKFEPQDQADPERLCSAHALAGAPHTDLGIMDRSGRALRRAADRRSDQAGHAPLRQKAGDGDQHLHRRLESGSQTLPMDQVGRRHPGVSPALLPTYGRRPAEMWIEISSQDTDDTGTIGRASGCGTSPVSATVAIRSWPTANGLASTREPSASGVSAWVGRIPAPV